MKAPRNQVVGLIRFSFATIGDFYPGFDDIGAMQKFLFDPERLERRFAWFEALCLPSLLRQSDPDFTCILLVGANMPGEYKDRLAALAAPLAAARLIEAPPDWHYSGIKKAFAKVPSDRFTHRTTFRLDDDDAVDGDYIARLKRLVPQVMAINGQDRPAGIAFNRGFYVVHQEGRRAVVPVCERMPISVGTAMVAPVAHPENIYLFNHRALAQHVSTYLDTTVWAYLRSVHRDNKADPKRTGETFDLPNSEVSEALRSGFGTSLQALKHLAIP